MLILTFQRWLLLVYWRCIYIYINIHIVFSEREKANRGLFMKQFSPWNDVYIYIHIHTILQQYSPRLRLIISHWHGLVLYLFSIFFAPISRFFLMSNRQVEDAKREVWNRQGAFFKKRENPHKVALPVINGVRTPIGRVTWYPWWGF